jgi:Uncharacterized protein conserved in bacteria
MMNFVIDAQLPFTLKVWFLDRGFDAIHTNDLPKRNRTSDIEIADLAVREKRILISKDSDFLKLKILHDLPSHLLLITTGNINNNALGILFERNFASIEKLFESFDIVELSNNFVLGRNLD